MATPRIPSPFGLSRCLLCNTLQHLTVREQDVAPVAVCQKPICGYEERL